MEVPGRRQDPCQNQGSQGDVPEFCLPCESEGQHVPANGGFCQTCEHYLCEPCYNAHIIPLPCKNHVLIDKNSMPKSNLAKSEQASNTCTRNCTIRCSYHRDKVIEFFCSAHNEVVCSVCAVLKHKPCTMDYIPDVAMSYKDSQEYKDLADNLKGLKNDVQSLSDDIKENVSHLPKSVETALDDIRQFRMEINVYLNKKEQELVLAARKLENQDSEMLGKLVFDVNELGTELSGLTKQLTSAKYVVSDLFVTSKQMTKDLDLLLEKLTRYTVENKKIEFQFKSGDFLSDLLSSDAALGAVDRISQTQPASYFRRRTTKSTSCMRFRSGLIRQGRDIDVKANKDKRDSVITGLTVLPPHRLLLVDSFNCSVKTADIRSNRIMSCQTLSSMPWDITTLPHDQAAVTLPEDNKILVVATRRALSTLRTIQVAGKCHGIDSTVDSLVVSYTSPKKVEIMDFRGKVNVCIKKDNTGSRLFRNPLYVTVSEEYEEHFIYVSDYDKHSITKLTMNGHVLSVYARKEWRGLQSLTATGDGQLLVCNHENHTVDVLSENGRNIYTLLDSSQGVEYPQSVCFCADYNTLYISSGKDTVPVKVYSINKR